MHTEQQHSAAANDLRMEQDRYQAKAERERNLLTNEVASVQKERDDLLLQAEAEKQEELRIAANEKAFAIEKLNRLTEENDALKAELDRLKREAMSKASQDRVCSIISVVNFFIENQQP